MAPYAFRPLSSVQDADSVDLTESIRLIALQPGEGYEQLRCEIVHVKLIENPDYTALSYCWGPAGDEATLVAPDGDFQIRKSLEAALLQLRNASNVTNIWIDVICIDQTNEKEKAQQIGIMHKIYKQATTTVAWLGPATTSTSVAFDLLKRVYAHLQNTWHIRSLARNVLPSMESICSYLDLPPPGDPEWLAVGQLLANPYFERVWTLQEYIFAGNLDILSGEYRIPGAVPSRLVSFDSLLKCIAREQLADNGSWSEDQAKSWGFLQKFMGCSSASEKEGNRQMALNIEAAMSMFTRRWLKHTDSATFLREWQQDPAPTLWYFLNLARARKSTEPKDKIFSLLNLVEEFQLRFVSSKAPIHTEWYVKIPSRLNAIEDRLPKFYHDDPMQYSLSFGMINTHTGGPLSPDWELHPSPNGRPEGKFLTCKSLTWADVQPPPPIKVDYSLSDTDLLSQVAYHLLHQVNALDMFGCVDVSAPLNLADELASWIPDWSKPLNPDSISFSRSGLHSSDGNFWATGPSKPSPAITMVKRHDGFSPSVVLGLLGLRDSAVEFVRPIYETEDHYYFLREVQSLLRDGRIHRASASLLWSAWDLCKDEGTKANTSHRYSMFMTRRSCVGIGPARMQIGDQVVLLIGGRVPYIIRPRPWAEVQTTKSIHEPALFKTVERNYQHVLRSMHGRTPILDPEQMKRQPLYQFVGECYLPDIMQGEGLVWARAKNRPETMQNSTGPGQQEDNWLKNLGQGPFPFQDDCAIYNLC